MMVSKTNRIQEEVERKVQRLWRTVVSAVDECWENSHKKGCPGDRKETTFLGIFRAVLIRRSRVKNRQTGSDKSDGEEGHEKKRMLRRY